MQKTKENNGKNRDKKDGKKQEEKILTKNK